MKKFIELTFYSSKMKSLVALEDIIDVVERMRCEGKKELFREFKIIEVRTTTGITYECDYSCYEMLKHYLCDWKE